MFRLFVIIIFVASVVQARAPLESYKRYMILMVHGVGANTLEPYDYDPSYNDNRKSAIFDKSNDDARVLLDDANWQGNLGGTLQDRGFLGHTVWYDFYEPWQSPIFSQGKYGESLSKYLGDREVGKAQADSNPMGLKQEGKYYTYNGKRYDRISDIPFAQSEGPPVITHKEQRYFGKTPQSYWLNEFFPEYLKNEEPVKYEKFNGPFLELAKKDWNLWNDLRYKDKADSANDVPKKYILIGHSMGGLTTRDYIMNNFYKGDVDKLITLDSPHEGSAIANYVQYWHDEGTWANILDVISYTSLGLFAATKVNDLIEICGGNGFDYLKKYDKMLALQALLLSPAIFETGSKAITSALQDYSANQKDDGKPYTERGIEVMTLPPTFETKNHSNAFLKSFNNKENLTDSYENGYNLPYFRLVSTSGVPTPGGHGWHEAITIPYYNVPAIIHGIIC